MRKLQLVLAIGLSTFIFQRTTLALATSNSPDDKAATKEDAKNMTSKTFSGLKWRSIGPALLSGRICDFAVDPNNRARYFAATCSGGVWKTENAGVTYEPVFDKASSYSVGCVTMDPSNPNVIWVGSGENNSQRSVSFGDGVYRSRDGGKNWENVGLKNSEHIGMIVIDPRDSNVVYVAAQGPLWRAGGDRGLYKTTDDGKTWERILHISDDTGVNEVHMDPRNPDVLYASSYQRRRHVWTLINGGPESDIYKSTNAGKTWRKLTSGLPKTDKGRIGMCISPADPDVVYAIVEAANDKGGFFRSTDRGETWKKRFKYNTSSAQYYNEIICDPQHVDRVYVLDTFMNVTENGGQSFNRMPNRNRHVDDHALWIDPDNTDYLIVGCDGGIYESFDRGQNWDFKANLPITQYYHVSVDNSEPFYYVYGGTQDNNSEGGPSRTKSPAGITNEDWFITVGGDGYESRIDPQDPNTVYAQWQYGGLIRYDRVSGETVDIKPRENAGDKPYRWNWDTPLIISPHSHTRLYFAANRLFRSEDRGNSWETISGDLTRQLDRDAMKIMGKVQSVDAVAKNRSTSIYGNAVALDESPLVEGLIYVGTDDGVVSITEDGGQNWRTVDLFPGVPDLAYVSCLTASMHDADTVYATFDNHKMGDFQPYLLKSTDRGHIWKSISGDLKSPEIAYTIKEDHVESNLLFVGTEFGLYFTKNGGERWIKLDNGLPKIAVRDIDIQRRENDLAIATFGRGFYILDDYSPLRYTNAAVLKKEAFVFPVKTALRYVPTSRLGGRTGKGSQGDSFFAAPNPPFGAIITYYLKDKIKTRKEQRQEAEKKAYKAGETPSYPTFDELRAEDQEKEPAVWLVVRDEAGNVLKRVKASRNKGMHRAAWDLRYPSPMPTRISKGKKLPPWERKPTGPLALPGKYTVTLAKQVDDVITELTEPESFDVVPLELATFAATDREAAMAFNRKAGHLLRAVQGASRAAGEYSTRLAHIRKAVLDTPGSDPALLTQAHKLRQTLNRLLIELRGDQTLSKHQQPVPPSIAEQSGIAIDWYVTSAPTQTQQDSYRRGGEAFVKVLGELRSLRDDITALEDKLEAAGGPWTPGRLPNWVME